MILYRVILSLCVWKFWNVFISIFLVLFLFVFDHCSYNNLCFIFFFLVMCFVYLFIFFIFSFSFNSFSFWLFCVFVLNRTVDFDLIVLFNIVQSGKQIKSEVWMQRGKNKKKSEKNKNIFIQVFNKLKSRNQTILNSNKSVQKACEQKLRKFYLIKKMKQNLNTMCK